MIYIQGLTDIAVYEMENNGEECTLTYSKMGSWIPPFSGKQMMSVSDTNGDLIHTIRTDKSVIKLDAGELIELYYLLDYMYNYSGMVNGINELHTMKFKEVE